MRCGLWFVSVAACCLLAGCDEAPQSEATPELTPTPAPIESVAANDAVKTVVGPAGKSNDPASVDLPEFKNERLLFKDQDAGAFAKAGIRAFPDIAKVRFTPDDSMKSDPEDIKNARNSFYGGLYYAKMIKAGDGSTLFDLITKCGRLTDPSSGAMLTPPMEEGATEWSVGIQYFPTFKMMGEDKNIDLQILLERRGNKLNARSGWFSSHVLDGASFMRDHGIQCVEDHI